MKICKNPNCTVPVNEQKFHKKASSKDGLAAVCTVCKAAKDRLYREQHSEALKTSKRQYRTENLEKVKRANKNYYENNKEKIAKKTKEYRDKNKDILQSKKSEYYKSMAGKLVAKKAKNIRRALKKSTSDNTVTKDYLETLLTIQNNRCYYCKSGLDLLTNGAIHLDHYIPLSQGGAHSCGNIVWTCPSCNLRKGTSIPNEPLVFPTKLERAEWAEHLFSK